MPTYHKRNESSILTSILGYLQVLENSGKIVHVDRLNSGAVRTTHKSRIRLCRPGTPDCYAVLKDGSILWIEAKNEKGKLNENQSQFRAKMIAVGHYWLLARSVDDVMEFIVQKDFPAWK